MAMLTGRQEKIEEADRKCAEIKMKLTAAESERKHLTEDLLPMKSVAYLLGDLLTHLSSQNAWYLTRDLINTGLLESVTTRARKYSTEDEVKAFVRKQQIEKEIANG